MKKLLTLLAVLVLMFTLVACGQKPAQGAAADGPVAEEVKGVTVPKFSVTVNGAAVDNDKMAAYPLYSVQAKSVNSAGTESTTTYVGFAMKDVCEAAGLTESYIWLEAKADDGYTVTITGDAVMQNTTLLAITKDGSQFSGSPWLAPCASTTTGDYLKGTVSILVNTTEGAPAGVSHGGGAGGGDLALTGANPDKLDRTDKVTFDAFSFKVNGTEVTNATLEGLSIFKVTVVVENSKGELSEATYIGYVLADVLEACGVSATTAKAVASDGYEVELSAEQVASEYTIVAIEKDKELGEGGSVWVAPCTETSSKSYAKGVVEIVTA